MRLFVMAVVGVFLFSATAVAQPPPPPPPGTDDYLLFEIVPTSPVFQYVSLAGSAQSPAGLVGDLAEFNFYIRDLSVDPSGPYAPKPTQEHSTTFVVEWLNSSNPTDSNWDGDVLSAWKFFDKTSTQTTFSGSSSLEQSVALVHQPFATVTDVAVRVTANMTLMQERAANGPTSTYREQTIEFRARIVPTPSVLISVIYPGNSNFPGLGVPFEAKPDSWVTIPIEVRNTDLYIQHLNLRLLDIDGEGLDKTKIAVQGDQAGAVFQPLETKVLNLSFKTPKEKTWYNSASLQYTIRAYNPNNPQVFSDTSGTLIVQGFYVSAPLKVVVFLLILLLIMFLLVLLRGKRYYDEKILGKPIPPWRIPQEAQALEAQRKTDPRTFYITRYFLMAEEYESALNWFYGYKRRTKTGLKREAKSSRLADRAAMLKDPSTEKYDVRADRIKRKMRRKQERQRLKLEAELNKLQGKLEKHYEEDFETDHEKWDEKVEKIKAKSNKPWFKARKNWERDVEKIYAAWEKPFAKDKAKREKEIEKAKEKYAKVVKKKDRETWQAWSEAVLANENENRIRNKEGRDALPEPDLMSETVGAPDLPKAFREPPKPKLPPEPVEPVVKDLPPEPKLELPALDASHYARKARRERKKSDGKVRRLERKMERMLAKNERDRVKSIAKAGRQREKLLRKSHRVVQPTLMDRLMRNTPEERERRAHKKLLKALAKERVNALEGSEKARLEVLTVDAQRREAELYAKIVRQQAAVRKSGGTSGMRVEEVPELVSLREANAAKLEREKAAAAKRVADERAKADADLRQQLTEELVKERSERERLQQQRQATILAKADAKAAARAEDAVTPEPPAKEPSKAQNGAPAKRGKK